MIMIKHLAHDIDISLIWPVKEQSYTCPRCGGEGVELIEDDEIDPCPVCNGTG